MIGTLPCDAKVVDLGCGTGSSAIILARTLGVKVTAIDLFPQFIDILKERAIDEGVAERFCEKWGNYYRNGQKDLLPSGAKN